MDFFLGVKCLYKQSLKNVSLPYDFQDVFLIRGLDKSLGEKSCSVLRMHMAGNLHKLTAELVLAEILRYVSSK